MPAQAFGDLCELQAHDGGERAHIKRPVHQRLEAGEERWLEVRHKLRVDDLEERGLPDIRSVNRGVINLRTAEIGGHQDHTVAEVDLATFTIAHRAAVEHLIEDVQHITVRLFDLVEQDDAVRALAHRLGQDAAAAVTDVARR